MKPLPALTDRQKKNFWSKVHIGEAGDCWEWAGLISPKGCGRIGFQNKDYLAHRVAYFLHLGVDPLDNTVTQTCSNHSCCNPAHLQLKSNAVLNESQVRYIREQAAKGVSTRTLARQYSVTVMTIHKIVVGKTWKDI